jgi:hypothetical protein
MWDMLVSGSVPSSIVPICVMPVAIVKTHVTVIEEKQIIKTEDNVCAYSAVKYEVYAMLMAVSVTMRWCMGRRRIPVMSVVTPMAS